LRPLILQTLGAELFAAVQLIAALLTGNGSAGYRAMKDGLQVVPPVLELSVRRRVLA